MAPLIHVLFTQTNKKWPRLLSSVCLSVCLSNCLSDWLSVCLCLTVWLTVCLSVSIPCLVNWNFFLLHRTMAWKKALYFKGLDSVWNHVHCSQHFAQTSDNERDDKWFLEFPSKMIECESVVIVNMCEAREASNSIRMLVYKMQVRLRDCDLYISSGHFSF